MRYLTKEELLQEIAAGNRTIKGLAAKFGLPPSSIKGALAKLEISLNEKEPESIKENDSPASVEDDWKQLHKYYDLEGIIGTQAHFIIAECRIKYGMTAAQARQYMKDNFRYETMTIKFDK